ncbi:MAG: glycosyltransferase family protein, partial [Bacteroidota bacterium]
MKIFYAVQATGNGHISRAMELLPYLRVYGQVDVFLSGANSQLKADMPVRYRSKGLTLFYNNGGGLNYPKIVSSLKPLRTWNEVKELPVEKYDVVINDFECITSLA